MLGSSRTWKILFQRKWLECKNLLYSTWWWWYIPTHTFLTYEKNNEYYWFKHSWERFRGIREYNSLKDLLKDIKDKFIKYELCDNYVLENLMLYEYKKPKYHISTQEFYVHCNNSINIF